MPVEMRLTRIIISEISENQVILLREVDGDRQFPILIGIYEASSIDRHVKGKQDKSLLPTRPLTHNLVVNVAESLGGELDSIYICELRDHTYFAELRIKVDGELVEVDARPSDAIAIAMACDPPLPIFVAEEVLTEASKTEF